jgi:hypothetical protein
MAGSLGSFGHWHRMPRDARLIGVYPSTLIALHLETVDGGVKSLPCPRCRALEEMKTPTDSENLGDENMLLRQRRMRPGLWTLVT